MSSLRLHFELKLYCPLFHVLYTQNKCQLDKKHSWIRIAPIKACNYQKGRGYDRGEEGFFLLEYYISSYFHPLHFSEHTHTKYLKSSFKPTFPNQILPNKVPSKMLMTALLSMGKRLIVITPEELKMIQKKIPWGTILKWDRNDGLIGFPHL